MLAELSPLDIGGTSQVAALGVGAVVSAVTVIGVGAAVEYKVVTSAALSALLYTLNSSNDPWK